jgi:thiol:disulfide interchange protein DsbC
MTKALLIVLLLTINTYASECLNREEAQSILNRVLRTPFSVKSVKPSRIKGLCRIDTKEGETFFIDEHNRFLLEGILIPIPELKFSEEEMRRIEKLVAFSVGKSEKFIYVIADPACETCRKNSGEIKRFLDKKIEVRFLLAPITHEGKGFKTAVSIICDRKGLSAFKTGYTSKNLCDRGKLKVWSIMDILKIKGITSVPTFITPDGKVYSGANSISSIIEEFEGKN